MGQIGAASDLINSRLALLSEKATNIGMVVTTISKVADQTNLLSLNAAIEAEKAGEHGRGFAVVAREIRRLADQTAVATFDIEQIVKEMQSAVSAGVMGIDKFADEVRRGREAIGEVTTQLTEIIAQVQTLPPSFESCERGSAVAVDQCGADQRGVGPAERRVAADGGLAAAVEHGDRPAQRCLARTAERRRSASLRPPDERPRARSSCSCVSAAIATRSMPPAVIEVLPLVRLKNIPCAPVGAGRDDELSRRRDSRGGSQHHRVRRRNARRA